MPAHLRISALLRYMVTPSGDEGAMEETLPGIKADAVSELARGCDAKLRSSNIHEAQLLTKGLTNRSPSRYKDGLGKPVPRKEKIEKP